MTDSQDTRIVRAEIHPAIGVARVGDSTEPDGYYIGPEVTNPPLTPQGGTRDASGALLRQAARFRIYGYNAAGEVVGEIGCNDADITWTAHIANKKAAWYEFEYALDLPQAAGQPGFKRRNAKVTGDARDELVIDPGPRSIKGANTQGEAYHFTGGAFMDTPVPLGELRTDEQGRLLVLGGHGKSASPEDTPIYIPEEPESFNNAAGWYDDTSDGPVTATVKIDDREIPVAPAWVIATPPNYAPDVIGWRTMYDLQVEVNVNAGTQTYPETVSFTQDVLPFLQRLSNLQWVNAGFATMFGKGMPMDFDNVQFVTRLAEKDADTWDQLRQVIFNCFRPADNDNDDPRTWPWIYGDTFGSFDGQPDDNLSLPELTDSLMRRWVAGNFINDYDPNYKPPSTIDEVPLADRPHMLTKASMHFCLADAFHPGCEMTWPMRHPTMYMEPFRIRHLPAGQQGRNDYGKTLDQETALQLGGPLFGQGPGDITRWMALPWQADTAFCRAGYDPEYDPYVPTFWPARVPNTVLTEEDYDIVVHSQDQATRLAAYNNREQWLRKIMNGSTAQVMLRMVAEFSKMGVIEVREGLKDNPEIPEQVFVENVPGPKAPQATIQARVAAAPATRPKKSRLEQAGFTSEAQAEEFNRVRRRGR